MNNATTTILAASLASTAFAVPSIDWYSVDAGGAVAAGGSISLRGVIGQPDAGLELSGGTTTLTGGFLAAFSGAVNLMGCNPADIVEPFGVLDLSDISVFITGFTTMGAIADLSAPFGVFDLADINLFVANFLAGCP